MIPIYSTTVQGMYLGGFPGAPETPKKLEQP